MILKRKLAYENLRPFEPTKDQPWNLQRVWTLHRRACFGATWEELQRDLADGPEKTIDRILNGKVRSSGVPENFSNMRGVIGDAAVTSKRSQRLIAWWVYQMYFSPDPLRQRLSILWHNHFATSNAKVNQFDWMRKQNRTFREFGTGEFETLLTKIVTQPAMLKWLDGDQNRLGKPNENLGRELLELFTLGVGNYTEQDVKEASRALTGWTVKNQEFEDRSDWHDDGNKKILGNEGKFAGHDLIKIVCGQEDTSKRLAWRIANEFLASKLANGETTKAIANELRENNLNIKSSVETILRSELLFSPNNLKQKIIEPESYTIGLVRAMEIFSPPASTMVLGDWIEQMGRKLFYPPNVGGWPGGRAWLNSRTTIARANFGAAMLNGRLKRNANPIDLVGLGKSHSIKSDAVSLTGFYLKLLTGNSNPKTIDAMIAADKKHIKKSGPKNHVQPDLDNQMKRIVAMIIASPGAQLS